VLLPTDLRSSVSARRRARDEAANSSTSSSDPVEKNSRAQCSRQPPWKMVIDDGTAPSFSFVQTAGDRSPCLSRVFDRATGGRAGRRGPCFRGFSVRNSLLPCSNRPVRRTQRSARGTRTGGGAYRGTVGAEASMYRPTRRCVHAESPGNRLSLFWLLLVIDAATVAKL
jgi:hypothetical protein